MSLLSKNSFIKKDINGRKYKIKKWSTLTTVLEGTKLGKVLLPSFTTIADVWQNNKRNEESLDVYLSDVANIEWLWTSAATQLTTLLTDEHCEDIYNKLLSGLYIMIDDEFVEIDNWSEHFDNDLYTEDFLEVLIWSIQVNLYDFFMKQGIFRSKIEVLKKALNKFKENFQLSGINED